MFRFFCSIWLIFAVTVAGAQPVTGRVIAAGSGERLTGATVRVLSDLSRGASTGIDGEFELTLPGPADTLLITYLGYEEQTRPVRAGEVVKIALQARATQLEQVVVRGEKLTAREFATQQLDQLDVYLNPGAKADALLAVNTLAAATNPDETANVSLRGSSPAATGIFLNNVPLHDAVRLDQANGVGQFSIFNTAMVEQVVVFPSNPPLEFGQASAGVVTLYTDDDVPRRAHSVSASLVGAGFSVSRPWSEKTGATLYGNWSTHHLLRALNPAAFEDILGFETVDLGAYFVHRLSDRSAVKVFHLSLLEAYRYRFRSASFNGPFRQEKLRNLSVVNWHYQGDSWRLEWNQGLNLSRASYGFGNIEEQPRQRDYYTSVIFRRQDTLFSWTTGAALDGRRLVTQGHFPLYPFAWDTDHPAQAFSERRRLLTPAGFAYLKWQIAPEKLTLGAGSRIAFPADRAAPTWSGQASLGLRLGEAGRLNLSAGQYYRHALARSFPYRQEWRSRQLALDAEWKPGDWTVQSAVYRKWERETGTPVRIAGAEMFAAYRSSRLEAGVSAASVRSRALAEGMAYPTAYDFGYFLRGNFRYAWPDGWSLTGTAWWREGSYFRPVTGSDFSEAAEVWTPRYAPLDRGARLPAYGRLDLGLSRIFELADGALIVFLSVNNVFDQRNVRSYSYNEDYSQRQAEYYNRRVLFFGAVWQGE